MKILEALGGRKFLAFVAVLIFTALGMFAWSPPRFTENGAITLLIAAIGIYVGGNVVEKFSNSGSSK